MVGDFNSKSAAAGQEPHEAMFDAIEAGDKDTVTKMLERYPGAPGWRNGAGSNPLMVAMIYRNEEIAKLLLETNYDIDHKDNDDWTPLIRAVDKDLPELVKIILAKGPDLEARIASSEMTALLVAGMMGRSACAELLLEAGASAEARDNRKLTAAQWAKRSELHETAKLIEEFPARREEKRLAEKAAAELAIDAAAQGGLAAPLQVGKPFKLKS